MFLPVSDTYLALFALVHLNQKDSVVNDIDLVSWSPCEVMVTAVGDRLLHLEHSGLLSPSLGVTCLASNVHL